MLLTSQFNRSRIANPASISGSHFTSWRYSMKKPKKVIAFSLAALAIAVILVLFLLFRRPLTEGTPTLSPDIESLRSQASNFIENKPRNGENWGLVVTSVNSKNVWISFVRNNEEAINSNIPVGSSREVSDCTVTVLESHPRRSGNGPGDTSSSALIAVQCPNEPSFRNDEPSPNAS